MKKNPFWVLIGLAIIGNLVNIFAPVSSLVRAAIAVTVLIVLAASCLFAVKPLEDINELRYR